MLCIQINFIGPVLGTWISRCGKFVLYPKPDFSPGARKMNARTFAWYAAHPIPNKTDFFEYPVHKVLCKGKAGDCDFVIVMNVHFSFIELFVVLIAYLVGNLQQVSTTTLFNKLAATRRKPAIVRWPVTQTRVDVGIAIAKKKWSLTQVPRR